MDSKQSPRYHARKTRANVPQRLSVVLAVLFLATPVAALPELPAGHELLGAFAAVVLACQCILIVSSALIGPLMGISSVLWLVMRNDAAIEPKWSWM